MTHTHSRHHGLGVGEVEIELDDGGRTADDVAAGDGAGQGGDATKVRRAAAHYAQG